VVNRSIGTTDNNSSSREEWPEAFPPNKDRKPKTPGDDFGASVRWRWSGEFWSARLLEADRCLDFPLGLPAEVSSATDAEPAEITTSQNSTCTQDRAEVETAAAQTPAFV
jgi:hypothetical protein